MMIIENGSIEDILNLENQIPEFGRKTTKEKLLSRLSTVAHLILVAKINGKIVGFKVGYEKTSKEFYSWLGGVLPDHRKKGIATALREHQERWAISSGYEGISVKSMNRFPKMLRLLILSNYQIVGFEETKAIFDGKILFYKKLSRGSKF